MALEMELKYLDVDLEALRRRLRRAGGEPLGAHFESNLVFDRPDRSLREQGVLLRLRRRRQATVLTVKRPPAAPTPAGLKVLEEIETEVADGAAARLALESLGFVATCVYEKIREQWRLGGCLVCLDRLPFGDFVEVEGEAEDLARCAASLGLDQGRATAASYHALHAERRAALGLGPEASFVFSPAQRARLGREIGEDGAWSLDSG